MFTDVAEGPLPLVRVKVFPPLTVDNLFACSVDVFEGLGLGGGQCGDFERVGAGYGRTAGGDRCESCCRQHLPDRWKILPLRFGRLPV